MGVGGGEGTGRDMARRVLYRQGVTWPGVCAVHKLIPHVWATQGLAAKSLSSRECSHVSACWLHQEYNSNAGDGRRARQHLTVQVTSCMTHSDAVW